MATYVMIGKEYFDDHYVYKAVKIHRDNWKFHADLYNEIKTSNSLSSMSLASIGLDSNWKFDGMLKKIEFLVKRKRIPA